MKRSPFLIYSVLKNWLSYKFGFPEPTPIGYVIIGVTYSCNAKCGMCGIYDIYAHNPDLIHKELPLSAVLARLKESSLMRKISHIDLTGGEPFLKEGLKDFIAGVFELKNIKLVSINTNGLLTDSITGDCEYILSVINPKKHFSVSISIDGIGDIHDRIRGFPGAFANVENTISRLKILRGRHANFKIRSNTVIQPENINFLNAIKDYWSNHGIEGAYSLAQDTFYTHSPRKTIPDGVIFSREDIEKIKALNPKSKGSEYYLEHNFTRPLHCFAGYAAVFIDPLGDVYPCNFLARNEEYAIGNIRHEAIDNIWSSANASFIRAKARNCPYKSCWNGCEVDQTTVQYEPMDKLIKVFSFGITGYYKIKGLDNFR